MIGKSLQNTARFATIKKKPKVTSISEHVEKSGNPCTPLAGMYKNSAAAVGN